MELHPHSKVAQDAYQIGDWSHLPHTVKKELSKTKKVMSHLLD